MDSEEKIEALEKQIEDIKQRLPAHSIPPGMLQQLDQLEEMLEKEKRKLEDDSIEK
jgi:hypothetical protein